MTWEKVKTKSAAKTLMIPLTFTDWGLRSGKLCKDSVICLNFMLGT